MLALVSFALMTADHRQRYLEVVRTGLSAAVYPLYYVVNLPIVAGGWVGANFTTHQSLKTENDQLRSEHLLLNAKVQTLAALDAENDRLRTLLEASAKVSERVSVAEIVAVDIDPYARKLVLNKGAQEGVYEGQPLISGEGVLGQVIKVGGPSSIAMLITDTGHSLPVMLNRTGLRAIAVGMGASGALDLSHLPNSTDIKVGDLLVTSGLDGRFPPNYPAAVVTHAEKMSSQPFMQVRAVPAAHLEHNREVLLVWHVPPAPVVTKCDPAKQKCAVQGSTSAAQGRVPEAAAVQGSAPAAISVPAASGGASLMPASPSVTVPAKPTQAPVAPATNQVIP